MAKRGSDEWRENIRKAKLANPSHEYAAIHHMVRQQRTGSCSNCGKVGWTDMAYKHHPAPYTRNPDDFHELCRSCHKTLYPQSPETRAKIAASMRQVRAKQRLASP